jgi:purine-binding chemotaxis protein CheW
VRGTAGLSRLDHSVAGFCHAGLPRRGSRHTGILAIKEIIEYSHLTTVPMTPEYVRGVINLRGAAVPVLDLSVRFGRQPGPVTKRTCIVIVEIDAAGARHDIGLVVDAVNAVLDIPVGDIEPPPVFGARIRTGTDSQH